MNAVARSSESPQGEAAGPKSTESAMFAPIERRFRAENEALWARSRPQQAFMDNPGQGADGAESA